MTTRVVTAHVPQELARKLDGLAERLDRTRGWLVKEAIAQYVGLEEERERQTREALAEVDAEATVDHAQVEAWASGLQRRSETGRAVERKRAGGTKPTRRRR